MEVDEAQQRMREIQRIMETATLFTLLPGTAAIIGGALVLAGCGVSWQVLGSWDFAGILLLSTAGRIGLCGLWIAVAAVAIAVNAVFTTRQAARQHVSIRPRPAQAAMLSLTPCVVAATVLGLQFLLSEQAREVRYIAPLWMLLYGTGVYTAGLFSTRAPRVLGMAFILAGIVSLYCFPALGVITVAATFGLLHIAFGAYVVLNKPIGNPEEAAP